MAPISLRSIVALCVVLCGMMQSVEQMTKPTPDETCSEIQAVIFENRSGITVELYQENETNETLITILRHKKSISINTKPGDTFYFTPKKKRRKTEKPKDFMMYNITIQNYTQWIVLYKKEIMKDRNEQFELQKSVFLKEYFNKTGIEWRNFYPRDPLIHHYHKVNQNGDIIISKTDRTQFRICSENSETDNMIVAQFNDTVYCRNKLEKGHQIQYEMVNICAHGPVAFQILNFLSDDECDHLIELGKAKGLETLGIDRKFWNNAYVKDLFDSQEPIDGFRFDDQAWYYRHDSFIVDNIMRRIADMINISEDKLYLNKSAEAMNLFHYYGDTEYMIHLDANEDKPNAQYLTLLLYLNDVERGGNTEFTAPDARCADEDGLIQIKPVKGSIMFVYNLLPDGNVDRKSEHHNMPPVDCEKWMANVWVWDKVFQLD